MAQQKFATQMDEAVLQQLRETAKATGISISMLVQDAVVEHLRRVRVRPAFREAMDDVLTQHADLLARLAK